MIYLRVISRFITKEDRAAFIIKYIDMLIMPNEITTLTCTFFCKVCDFFA